MRELESRLAVLHAEKEERAELKRALAENARARGHVHSARREHEHELPRRARVADAAEEAPEAEARPRCKPHSSVVARHRVRGYARG